MKPPDTILVLSAGSPLVADLEETCHRAGIAIRAIVVAPGETDYALQKDLVVAPDALADDDLALPAMTPMFTPGLRQRAYDDFAARLGQRTRSALATVLDPSSSIARSCDFGEGTYVNGGAALGAASRYGRGCMINRGSSLGHHLVVGDFVAFGPGATVQGDAVIEKGAMIGTNATVLEYVTIGANSVVAAGSVVTTDVPANSLVRGFPARVVKRDIAGYKDVPVR